ncbi:thymidylate synthase [Streptomyces sp. NPDC057909]|uniref:thymidylate synthase n=1 Tax=Streptomyces sp. NPDC057909 TaxID=3346277 RepID=UPI0036EA3E91
MEGVKPVRYAGITEAYVSRLDGLLRDPEYLNSPRGFASQEHIGVSFSIDDPRRRLIPMEIRRSNLVFNVAEVLWYFSGRDDLEYMSYYAPGIRRFVMGADALTGTAYGPRIFNFGSSGLDQWESVAETLRDDADTKRAVIQIYRPEELTVPGNPDVACTIGLQFLARDGRLNLVGYMRANDAYRGMASDIFSFTFLQELMARKLGLELGRYTHMVGSLHLYEPDLGPARRLVAAPRGGNSPDDRMPAMPSGDQRPHVERVMQIEEGLRTDAVRLGVSEIRTLGLPEYWRQIVAVFELYRRCKHRTRADDDGLLDELHPLYRHLMANRFPELSSTPRIKAQVS